MKRREMKKMLSFIEAKYNPSTFNTRLNRKAKLFECLLPSFKKIDYEDYNMGPLNGALSFLTFEWYQDEIEGKYSYFLYFKNMGNFIRIWEVERDYEGGYYEPDTCNFIEEEEEEYRVTAYLDISFKELVKVIKLAEFLDKKGFTSVRIRSNKSDIEEEIASYKGYEPGPVRGYYPTIKRRTVRSESGNVVVFYNYIEYTTELTARYDKADKIVYCLRGKEDELYAL